MKMDKELKAYRVKSYIAYIYEQVVLAESESQARMAMRDDAVDIGKEVERVELDVTDVEEVTDEDSIKKAVHIDKDYLSWLDHTPLYDSPLFK